MVTDAMVMIFNLLNMGMISILQSTESIDATEKLNRKG